MGVVFFALLISLVGIGMIVIAHAILILIELPFMLLGKVTDNRKFICWVNVCLNTILPGTSMFLQSLLPKSLNDYLSIDARYVLTLVFVMVVIRTLIKFWLYGMISKAEKSRVLTMTFMSNLLSGLLIFLFFVRDL